MTYELRAITDDEVSAFRSAMAVGFGSDSKPELDDRFRKLMPLDRTVAAFDGTDVVGTLGDFDLQLTVPGGSQLTMAGTTMVTVRSTDTRRGILRSMMCRHLDNAVERGDAVAGLWASEPAIYGRFGFGLATECHFVTIDRRHLAPPPVADDLRIAVLGADRVAEVMEPFWHELATRPHHQGFIDRDRVRWDDIADDLEVMRNGASAARHVVVERAGQVVGYVKYRQKGKWDDFVPLGTASIGELVALDADAHLALWSHMLTIDLFPHIEYGNAAIDDPLAYVVAAARTVRRVVSDALYVRLLDIPAALGARTYEQDGQLVLKVVDAMGYVDGTYRLTVTAGSAKVERTTEPAGVELDCRELGALYLGRPAAALYAATGRISGDSEAVATLGRLFATSAAPWCSEDF